jgi:hypothetical protein
LAPNFSANSYLSDLSGIFKEIEEKATEVVTSVRFARQNKGMNAETHALFTPEVPTAASLAPQLAHEFAQVRARLLAVQAMPQTGRRQTSLPEFLQSTETYIQSSSPAEYQFHISRANAQLSKCRHLGLQLSAIAALTQINGVPEAAESLNGFVHQLKETSDALLHNVQFTGDLLSHVAESCAPNIGNLQALHGEVTFTAQARTQTQSALTPTRDTYVKGLDADLASLEERLSTLGKISVNEQAQVLVKAQVDRYITDLQIKAQESATLRTEPHQNTQDVHYVDAPVERLIKAAKSLENHMIRPRRDFTVVSQMLDVLTLETRKLRNTSVNAGILSSKHGAGGAALLVLAESVRDAVRTMRGMLEQLKSEVSWLQTAVDKDLQPPDTLANGEVSFAAQGIETTAESDAAFEALFVAVQGFTTAAQRAAKEITVRDAPRPVFVRASQSDPATSRWAQAAWQSYTSQSEREVHVLLYGEPHSA